MAGIKVTDLPVLAESAPDDVMYIVDTSTNTSSQIEVADIKITAISSTASGDTASFIASAGSRLQADFNGYRPLFLSGTEEADTIIGFFAKANVSAGSLQAAAIADATDATDVITQLNTLLAAMRAYGLIAE